MVLLLFTCQYKHTNISDSGLSYHLCVKRSSLVLHICVLVISNSLCHKREYFQTSGRFHTIQSQYSRRLKLQLPKFQAKNQIVAKCTLIVIRFSVYLKPRNQIECDLTPQVQALDPLNGLTSNSQPTRIYPIILSIHVNPGFRIRDVRDNDDLDKLTANTYIYHTCFQFRPTSSTSFGLQVSLN